MSNLSATSNYSNNAVPGLPAGSESRTESPFFDEVKRTDELLVQLSNNIDRISALHNEAVNSADSSPPAGLEASAADTQTLNTTIRNNIKYLEADAARSGNDPSKTAHVNRLKRKFQAQLEKYREEEKGYQVRRREQFGRQYRIVNPDASQREVDEASQQNWGNASVFQTAVSIRAFQCDLT
jgi:syntaxin 1B/2/3